MNMKYLMTFESFNNKTGRDDDLIKLGSNFNNTDEIVNCILALGMKPIKLKYEKSAEYLFEYPYESTYKDIYVSNSTGRVRVYSDIPDYQYWGRGPKRRLLSTRSLNKHFRDTTLKDRLLIILRAVMKRMNVYKRYRKSNLPIKDFIHDLRGTIAANRYGL